MSVIPQTYPNIFSYKDYRFFLRDLFLWKKSQSPRSISYESFARKASLSKTFFRYVLARKRHLSMDSVPRISKIFNLSSEEKHFLTYLVCHGISRDSETKQFFEFSIQRLKGIHLDTTPEAPTLSSVNKSTFGSGLAMVIYSLTRQKKFRPTPQWILSKLPPGFASIKLVEEVLQSLLESKSIVQDEKGHWKTGGFVYNHVDELDLKGFLIYRRALSFMWHALEYAPLLEPLSCHMMSLSFDDKSYEAAVKCFIKCRDDIIELSKKVGDPTRVIYLNMNMAGIVK